MQGQINLGSSCGDTIKDICEREDVATIVEIGTWNGEGTTQCVLAGMKARDSVEFWSLECDKGFFDAAKKVVPEAENVYLLHGSIVEIADLDRSSLRDEEKLWLSNDERNMEGVPIVLNQLPESIDFLILDGGEFASRKEFLLLRDKCKIIFLDDTGVRKNKLNKVDLDNDEDFKVVIDEPSDRNGWALYERVSDNN